MAQIGRSIPSHALVAHGLTAQQLSLSVESGSYGLVGQASINAFSLTCVTGTYTYTGVAASLTVFSTNKTLPADSGSYSLTGTSTGLFGGFRSNAETTSYTLTGTSVGVFYGSRCLSAGGTYTLTGTSETLRAARVVGIAAGSYTISGSTVTLNSARLITLTNGQYLIVESETTQLTFSGGSVTTHLLAMMGLGG